jgi:hypothetical protein
MKSNESQFYLLKGVQLRFRNFIQLLKAGYSDKVLHVAEPYYLFGLVIRYNLRYTE